jgi:hypothetical protein
MFRFKEIFYVVKKHIHLVWVLDYVRDTKI